MAKNRKNASAPFRFSAAVKALFICLLIGGIAVGYVEQQKRLYVLGGQYGELEVKLDRLRRENAGRARILDMLQSPAELEARVKQMNLGLMPPRPEQILRLEEKTGDPSWQNQDHLYADRNTRSVDRP